MSTLYAGPFVGEFGHELFCWSGYLRRQAKRYKRCVVACRRGHEKLYNDFAETIPQDIDSDDCDLADCKGYSVPAFSMIFDRPQAGNPWIEPKQAIVRYDYRHRHDGQPLYANFYKQSFVRLGTPTGQGYDVLMHARDKSNKVNANLSSHYRNWQPDNWHKLLEHMQPCRVASVGTRKAARYIAGDDLRGLPLDDLCNVLASSKLLVSPSSGVVHLAALCLCSTVTWFGQPYQRSNAIRFITDWNPFNAPVGVLYSDRWQPTVAQVLELTQKPKHEN